MLAWVRGLQFEDLAHRNFPAFRNIAFPVLPPE